MYLRFHISQSRPVSRITSVRHHVFARVLLCRFWTTAATRRTACGRSARRRSRRYAASWRRASWECTVSISWRAPASSACQPWTSTDASPRFDVVVCCVSLKWNIRSTMELDKISTEQYLGKVAFKVSSKHYDVAYMLHYAAASPPSAATALSQCNVTQSTDALQRFNWMHLLICYYYSCNYCNTTKFCLSDDDVSISDLSLYHDWLPFSDVSK